MSDETTKKQELIKAGETLPSEQGPKKIQLGPLTSIDTLGLTEEQVQQLTMKHAEGMIELNKKAQELQIDVGATRASLEIMAANVQKVSEAGDAVTITNVQKNALGHTEIVMGNTDAAAKGRLSAAQRGEPDRTLWYVIIAAAVIVIIALAFAK